MSDWQVGDLALCVANSQPALGSTKRVVPGRIYTVADVYVGSTCGTLALVLVEASPRKNPGFNACLFRKINPHTPDEFDRETIALLNGQPAKRELADAMFDAMLATRARPDMGEG